MRRASIGQSILAFIIVLVTAMASAQGGPGAAIAGAASRKSSPAKRVRAAKAPNKISRSSAGKPSPGRCGECEASARTRKSGARSTVAKAPPCKKPGYMNPAVKGEFNSALQDLKRSGIKPVVTSTWRSSEHQAKLHRCSRSNKCRKAHPGLYYAKPPGSSLHEAGFAVDISGVASGPRGAKRLTPRGRRIVRVMQKNGFRWRYGLADPAHFEADPRKHGYRSASQAINLSQSKCQVRLASGKKKADKKSARSSKQVSRSGKIRRA